MIFTVLSTTHTEVTSGKYITLPETIQEILQLEEGAQLSAYSNAKDNELYISVKQLEIPLGVIMIYGPNEPGVIAEIASSFGEKNLNIIAFNSFGIGKSGMAELIVQEYPSSSSNCSTSTEPKVPPTDEKPRFTGEFEAVVDNLRGKGYTVYAQELLRVLPEVPMIPKIPVPVSVKKHAGTSFLDLRISELAMDQLKLDISKEYHVLLTYYVRFPLLIVRFVTKPNRFLRIQAEVSNRPKVLGHLCNCIKDVVNLSNGTVQFGLPHGLANQVKARVDLYGELEGGATKKDVEQALFAVNKKGGEELIDSHTITVRLITEVGED